MPVVLLQESDSDLQRVVAHCLEQKGWQVLRADSRKEALLLMERKDLPGVLIVELDLPDDSTKRIIDRYRERTSSGKVLITTDDRPGDKWRRDVRPDAVVYKPYDIRYLIKSLQRLADSAPAPS